MRIFVTAKPNKKEEKIKKIRLCPGGARAPEGESIFEIHVKEPAKEGRANKAIVKILAKHFKIAPSNINLIGGQKSRQKIFEAN